MERICRHKWGTLVAATFDSSNITPIGLFARPMKAQSLEHVCLHACIFVGRFFESLNPCSSFRHAGRVCKSSGSTDQVYIQGGPNHTGPRILANNFRNAARIFTIFGRKQGHLILNMTT